MGLHIRHLEMRAMTEAGPFGASIGFGDGLTVIWADNSSGKSTTIMSILYALGLEGMLGPGHQVPLTGAMIDELLSDDGTIHAVTDSFVRLEVQNSDGASLTTQRAVTGDLKSRQLIRTQVGPALTAPGQYPTRDFYVRIGGAATEGSGFHTFLAEFAGFSLPEVATADQARVPLYLECLFPFFFVDQISGWRDVKARMPTYLRIPEMAKRATEFIMRLDVLQRQIDRQALQQEEAKLRQEWDSNLQAGKQRFVSLGGVFQGIPSSPTAIWPPSPPPELRVTDGDRWFSASEAQDAYWRRLYKLQQDEIPRAEQVSEEVLGSLRRTEEALAREQRTHENLTRTYEAEQAHIAAIDRRLSALKEDLQKHQDAKKLEDRGGFNGLDTVQGTCPTCQRGLQGVLLPQNRSANPMSVETNIAFLKDQIETFQEIREDSHGSLAALEKRLGAIRLRIAEISGSIRALRRTLRSDAAAPSAAAIQEQLILENRIDRLEETKRAFEEVVASFNAYAEKWNRIQSQIRGTDDTRLSQDDRAKIGLFNDIFLEQLREYGFGSYRIEDIAISEATYRPTLHGFELGLTSASDTIRVLWAYLVGLLELAQAKQTNHIGFIVFDEPKQQGTRVMSFEALLKRASRSAAHGQQVIFATSEDRASLEQMLAGVPCDLKVFDRRILQPVSG